MRFFQPILTILIVMTMTMPVLAFTPKEQVLAGSYKESLGYAASYALNQMRPTVNYTSSKILRIKESDMLEGGLVKARMETHWTDALLKDPYVTVIDVWITPDGNAIYLTRFKKYSDNNRIPIVLSTDERCRVLLQTLGPVEVKEQKDDF